MRWGLVHLKPFFSITRDQLVLKANLSNSMEDQYSLFLNFICDTRMSDEHEQAPISISLHTTPQISRASWL